MASVDEVIAQMVAMSDRISALEGMLSASHAREQSVSGELQAIRDRIVAAEATSSARPASTQHDKGGLYDKRMYEPERLKDTRETSKFGPKSSWIS